MRFSAAVALGCAVMALALCGCWPFHHQPTPQQQFLDALNHGHSAEASQIWLKMSEKDREKWARGQGLSPQSSPDQIKKQIMQHYQNEAGGEQEGESGVVQINPGPPAGLQNLPSLMQASPSGNPAPPGTSE